MMLELHKYRISGDGGITWTEQWLTNEEANEEKKENICEMVAHSVKHIWA